MAKRGEARRPGEKPSKGGLTMENIRLKAAQFAPPVKTLRDMSEREIRQLEVCYGCPVIRPT
jgi:hypothetical protein